MMYTEDFVEEVRSRSDIVDVVGQYVHLERKGANFFGLCPFHNEKSPSFSVHRGKQIFHCFGCGEGGNVFTFLMKYENMSFPEAVKSLAERAGMQVPEEHLSDGAMQARNKRQELLAINKEAALYYYHLLHEEAGKRGLDYFKERGLSDVTIRHFGLGYAAVGGSPLTAYLRSKGYTDAQVIEAGLAAHDEKRGVYDKFWNRVMFPIFDSSNRVIGFGGRVMGDGKPKYLNSPETPVFDKGRNLYGLNYAKNARTGHVILCEGYMDVIAMHQAGFTEALASLGTAFTGQQATLLKRYTEDVILSYDSDEAGIKAAMRAIGILKESGLRGRVLNLSPHKDPDEFIKAEGKEAFQDRLRAAESTYFFELRIAQRDYDLSDPDGRTRFIRAAAKRLCEFGEPIERENYIAATAQKYGVALEDLRRLVSETAAREGIAAQRREPRRTGTDGSTANKSAEERGLKPQRMLLTWLTDEPELLSVVTRYLTPEDFSDELYRKVAERVFRDIAENRLQPAAIISAFPEEEDQKRIAQIFDTPMTGVETKAERERAMENLIRDIKKRSMERKMEGLKSDDPQYLQQVIANRKAVDSLDALKIRL
ncbi:MAG: DNA primase [Lachnospiraceae bacterium]|nr:DNA primase [Lachnospiraceae bacterium]